MNKISIILIFSLIFIAFTKFRLFGLPIGVGEICLLLLGVISLKKIVLINKIKLLKYLYTNSLLQFWILNFSLLFIAYIWIYIIGVHHSDTNVIHDVLAYGFSVYMILLLMILNKYFTIDYESIMLKLVIYTALLYIVVLMFSIFYSDIIGFRAGRFVGFANNPNQLALIYTVIPFMLIYFYNNKDININKKIIIISFIFTLIVLFEINSRGLFLAWIISTLMIYCYKYYSRLSKKNKITLYFIISILFLIVILNFNEIVNLLFSKGTGGFTHRIELWTNAIELIKTSPFIGFGPGAHVSSIVDTTHYWEVHNTFLDLTVQTGLIGLFFYLVLLYKIGKNLYINGDKYLMGAFIALIIFSTFHFILRQPIFWFYLFYFYQVGREKKCVQ